MVPIDAFGELAAFRVSEPDTVAEGEALRRRTLERRLHFARALAREGLNLFYLRVPVDFGFTNDVEP